ncbi:hypothetical protein X737_35670 [Mesorhizobium sp. L48C026A00]|nr:hypothetical protein X737_35670 [Mesorhizobium sp. L48C026A00]
MASVIGAVDSELSDRTVNLVEQWAHLRSIAGVLVGQGMGDGLTAIGIQRQMQLGPATAGFGTMHLL